jgi:hypothetical protein
VEDPLAFRAGTEDAIGHQHLEVDGLLR